MVDSGFREQTQQPLERSESRTASVPDRHSNLRDWLAEQMGNPSHFGKAIVAMVPQGGDKKLPGMQIYDGQSLVVRSIEQATDAPPDRANSDVVYTSIERRRAQPDDHRTSFSIEKDESGRHVRITDANGCKRELQLDADQSTIVAGQIFGGDGKIHGEIKNGKYEWVDREGNQHTEKLRNAKVTGDGSIELTGEDGRKRVFGPHGGVTDFDAQGRPACMTDANGNIFQYKDYTQYRWGRQFITVPNEIRCYDAATNATTVYRINTLDMAWMASMNVHCPMYSKFENGAAVPGSGFVGAGPQVGPISAGIGVQLDNTQGMQVMPDGTLATYHFGSFPNRDRCTGRAFYPHGTRAEIYSDSGSTSGTLFNRNGQDVKMNKSVPSR